MLQRVNGRQQPLMRASQPIDDGKRSMTAVVTVK